jgi:hypothetical protein
LSWRISHLFSGKLCLNTGKVDVKANLHQSWHLR